MHFLCALRSKSFNSLLPIISNNSNADLRMIFYRIWKLWGCGVLPVFILDGPRRPAVKRGKKISGSNVGRKGLLALSKKLFEFLGIRWRVALGEAEAELAALARAGLIHVVLTVRLRFFSRNLMTQPRSWLQDDVDTLLFGVGSGVVVRNCRSEDSPSLLRSYTHARIFEKTRLTRDALVEVALLAGGDYDAGIRELGIKTAVALVRAG